MDDVSQVTSSQLTAFNFSRAGLIGGDQMRTLRTLDEQFTRNLTHTLGAWLRSNVSLNPVPAEQSPFGKFVERTSNGFYVLPLGLQMGNQHVRGALALSLGLAPVIIDLLLGGSGRTAEAPRELTEIEEAVLSSVIELILREWSSVWSPLGVEFTAEPRERDGHGQRMMPLHEKAFCSKSALSLADVSGDLIFCLPSTALLAILRQTSSRRERQRQRTAEEQSQMVHRMSGAVLQASLCFPVLQIHALALQQIQIGALLPLQLQRGSSAELRVNGKTLFRAEPVRSGDHRAAQIVYAFDSTDTEAKL